MSSSRGLAPEPTAPAPPKATRRQPVASASVAAFIGLGGSAIFTAALGLVLTRELSRVEYGLFALALSIHQISFLLADLGITPASSRRLAAARDSSDLLPAVAGSALFLKITTAIAASSVLFLVAPAIASLYAEPGLRPVLEIAAAALLLANCFQLARLGLNAVGRTWQMCALALVESALEFTASLALVLALGRATAAMAGRIAGFGVGCLLGFYLLRRAVGHFARPRREIVREVASSGLLLGLTDAAYVLFTQIDVLLIGGLLGATSVAIFEPAVRVLILGGFVGYAIALASTPRLAATADPEHRRREFEVPLKYATCLQGALVIGWILLVAPNAVVIFGRGFAATSPILYLLTPYLFLAGLAPMLSSATVFLGGARQRLLPCLIALSVNAAIDAALLPGLGVRAAALGTTVGALIYVGLYGRLCASLLDMPVVRLFAPLAPIAAASVVTAGVAYGLSQIDPTDGFASLVVTVTLYVVMLRATGVLTHAQLRRGLAALRRPRLLLTRG